MKGLILFSRFKNYAIKLDWIMRHLLRWIAFISCALAMAVHFCALAMAILTGPFPSWMQKKCLLVHGLRAANISVDSRNRLSALTVKRSFEWSLWKSATSPTKWRNSNPLSLLTVLCQTFLCQHSSSPTLIFSFSLSVVGDKNLFFKCA